MLKVLLTCDYEIHGNGDGCPMELMVEPTYRMMSLFERFGAQLTIMADVAEILAFENYEKETGRDDFHITRIKSQLQEAVRRGHDVQLHLHPSYFRARHEGRGWIQDWSEYSLADLSLGRLEEIVQIGKAYLEDLLKPVAPDYECIAFRAANWSMNPSRNAVRALVNAGIRIDSSVFKWGKREGLVNFDYSEAPSNLSSWRAAEENVCQIDNNSKLLEVPIYSESRWIGAFVSRNRFKRAAMSRAHRIPAMSLVPNDANRSSGPSSSAGRTALRRIKLLFRKHAWKADFNQCTGRQLVSALKRASQADHGGRGSGSFVLIGHSKLFDTENEASLEPFLRFVFEHGDRFQFGTFAGALRTE